MTVVPSSSRAGSGSGGATLISDSTLGADAASFDLTAIAATFIALRVLADLRGTKAAATAQILVRLNNDSGANYDAEILVAAATSPSATQTLASTSAYVGDMPGSTATAGRSALFDLLIADYAGTTFTKNLSARTAIASGTGSGAVFVEDSTGVWRSTAAVSRITILPDSGNLLAGSRCTLWGLT